MTASYYFWKWADNELPGPPEEVHAALLRGQMHPAIQPFDPKKLIALLEKGAALALKKGEEWDWRIVPAAGAGLANAVFATAELPGEAESYKMKMARVLWKHLIKNQMAIYGEEEEVPVAGPVLKHNRFYTGQDVETYDVREQEIRSLLLTLRRTPGDAFAVLENRRGDYVQCLLEKKRRYVLEWRQFHVPLLDVSRIDNYDHWRLIDQDRLAALPEDLRNGEGELPSDLEPDLVSLEQVVEAFEAFVRGEPPPRLKHWRNVKEEI